MLKCSANWRISAKCKAQSTSGNPPDVFCTMFCALTYTLLF